MANTETRERESLPDDQVVDQGTDEPGEVTYVTIRLGPQGRPYHSDHVNAVYKMVRENGPEGRFICITDDGVGLEPGIEVVEPYGPQRYSGWLQKLVLFAPDLEGMWGITTPILYLDLDVVITGRLEALMGGPGDDFLVSPEFYTGSVEDRRCNSSVFWLRPGSMTHIWGACQGGLPTPPKGDQAVLDRFVEPKHFYDYNLVVSFKKDVLLPKTQPENLQARDPTRFKNPPDLKRSVVVAFHGNLKPWDVLAHPLVEGYYPMTEEQLISLKEYKARLNHAYGMNIHYPGDPLERLMR